MTGFTVIGYGLKRYDKNGQYFAPEDAEDTILRPHGNYVNFYDTATADEAVEAFHREVVDENAVPHQAPDRAMVLMVLQGRHTDIRNRATPETKALARLRLLCQGAADTTPDTTEVGHAVKQVWQTVVRWIDNGEVHGE